jgi:hypothetical protein
MSAEQFFFQEFQVFLQKARSLDLGPIAYQLTQSRSGPQWTREKTTQAIARYLAFLYLVDRYPGLQIAPTQEIDQVWHCHILDTSKYAEDCQHLFGYFVHHFPYLGTRNQIDKQNWYRAYALTQVLFQKHFGIDFAKKTFLPSDCEPLAVDSTGFAACRHSRLERPSVSVTLDDAFLTFSELSS